MPCFKRQSCIKAFKKRFCLDISGEEVIQYANKLISISKKTIGVLINMILFKDYQMEYYDFSSNTLLVSALNI